MLRDELSNYIPNISSTIDQYVELLLDEESGKPLKIIGKSLHSIFNEDKNPYELIKEILERTKHKTVVFIDDIDRLNAVEIKEVLRLIRNTANFPYIQFIVAYDKNYVCETLKNNGINTPDRYLEKFFNVEMSLPKSEERVLCNELLTRFQETINAIWGLEKDDLRITNMVYYRPNDPTNSIIDNNLVTQVLHTIRDVIRFHNSFYLLAKAYKDQSAEKEVCFQDLFFLELLRYRYLDVYTILCNRPFVLLSLDDNVFFMNDNYKSIIQNNLSSDEYTEVVTDILEYCDDSILGNIKNSFFGTIVLDQINSIWKDIIEIAILPKAKPYPKNLIVDKLMTLLSSPVTSFFSVTNIAFSFRCFSGIIIALINDPDKRSEYYRLNSHITSAIAQFLSTSLYQQEHDSKTGSWSSIYITRDTLTYGTDTAKTFSSMLAKLKDLGFAASYLYAYDEPVAIQPDGSWKTPDTLYLQAFYNPKHTAVLSGETRRIASTDIFDNEYTGFEDRFTVVIVPIFTNEQHHGLFVCNTDVNHFGHIYTTSLHLGASFKYLSLLKEQIQTKEQLVMSLNEIHEKNELLNHLSTSDELTGVNNRRGLMEKVEYLINKPANHGRKAMLLFADMDSLKIVNDKFGHNDGDFALKNIANILMTSFRASDIVGRIGGDEFVCFAFIDDLDFPKTVQARIQELSNELNETCGKPYYIEMSVGVSEFSCDPDIKIEDLLSQADSALYSNKRYKRMSVLK